MKLNATNTAILKRLLAGRNSRPLRAILSRLEAADIASLFGTLNRRDSLLLVEALASIDKARDVFCELPDPQLRQVLAQMPSEKLLNLVVYSPDDQSAYFLTHLEDSVREEVLQKLEAPKRSKIQQFLNYPAQSAGRLMETQVFSIPVTWTAAQGLDFLRQRAQEQSIYYIYCIDEEQRLVGTLSLRALATAPAERRLFEMVKKEVVSVSPETTDQEVAKIVAHYDFVAIPVVDKDGRLLGVITVDDVVDIIQDMATANLYAQAGLQKSDRVFTPALESIGNRLPWMFVNLALAGLASSVVSLFEDTMSHLIVLATLKNVVAGLGGNTAIQSLTVVTRGLATGDFSFISHARAIAKEVTVGVTLGLVTGITAGVMTYIWKQDLLVAIVIFLSMVLNALVASVVGASVPLALHYFGKDPATGSGVLCTMITDIFGFFSFLGIASLGLSLIS